MKFFNLFGEYVLLLLQVFKKPENKRVYTKKLWFEIDNMGLRSIGIVAFISLFMGAIATMQMRINLDNPLIPNYLIGYSSRQLVLLEFSPTVISLILAGKVGSLIASEIGTMRITEQIDALEVMGINSASYLIFPKMIAAMVFNNILIIISMFIAIIGGYLSCFLVAIPASEYIYGIQSEFTPFHLVYALIKTTVFAFMIASISGFYGYRVKGGALEVGDASTKSVVVSSILIIIFDLVLTQILLT